MRKNPSIMQKIRHRDRKKDELYSLEWEIFARISSPPLPTNYHHQFRFFCFVIVVGGGVATAVFLLFVGLFLKVSRLF